MVDKTSALTPEQIKKKVVELLQTKAISFVSFENDRFIVDIKENDVMASAIAQIVDNRVNKLSLDKSTGDQDLDKVYLIAAKYFINKYIERNNHIPVDEYIEHMKGMLVNPKSVNAGIPYDKVFLNLYPYYSYDEDETIKIFKEIYLYLRTMKRNSEVNTVEFIYKFIKKIHASKKVYIELSNLIGSNAIVKGNNTSGDFVLKIILRESSEYTYNIFSNLLNLAKEIENSDYNILLKASLETGCANEEQLIEMINVKNISSFYLSQAVLYAIESNFKDAVIAFTKNNLLNKLESNVQDALCFYLLNVDKELARITTRKVLESRPRYETYRLYKSLLNEEETSSESSFLEAVAKSGGFLGAYHLENGILISEAELNTLTPKQALDLSSNIDGEFAIAFGKLVKDKIEKLLARKSLPSEISEWLTILFRYSKKDYYEISQNPRILKEVINLPSFRRFFLFELDKEGLLEENGLFRYLG